MEGTETIICSKLNKSPAQISSPSLLSPPPRPNWFEINMHPRGLIEDLRYCCFDVLVAVPVVGLGTLSNEDGDFNVNGIKAIGGLNWQNNPNPKLSDFPARKDH